jgi:RNA polymerase sigma-70 factor (ECF subfamily)
VRVIEARERYAPKARFTTWLYTIAHNLLVDHWRKKGLSLVALDGDDVPSESANPRARPKDARPWRGWCMRWNRCPPRSARLSCCTRRAA